jgi:hypothetical protein
LPFSYWTIKPWFLTEGKLPAVLIIPSSWGSQLDGELHQHRATSRNFSGAIAREKEDFCKGSFACISFTLFLVLLLFYFYLHRFMKNTKN